MKKKFSGKLSYLSNFYNAPLARDPEDHQADRLEGSIMKKMDSTCVVCGKHVDWQEVLEQYGHIIERVDYYGEGALTDQEQTLYHQKVCAEHFEQLPY